MSKAIDDVLAERKRQIDVEGWTYHHDDGHTNGALALAGAAYAGFAGGEFTRADAGHHANGGDLLQMYARQLWPFDAEWWKPKDPRRDLVRAAALLIAEIERIDRHV
jgi:hypothetical protein